MVGRKVSCSKSIGLCKTVAVGEDIRLHFLTAFKLYFEKFERGAVAGYGEYALLVNKRSRRKIPLLRNQTRAPKVKRLAAE